jgi:hypothetical protein
MNTIKDKILEIKYKDSVNNTILGNNEDIRNRISDNVWYNNHETFYYVNFHILNRFIELNEIV